MSVTSRAPDFDIGFVRTWFARHWLAIWFGSMSLVRLFVLVTGKAGFDARLYLRATRAWPDGQDPWITVEMQRFAVPVLWPSTHWYHSTLAMPSPRSRPP